MCFTCERRIYQSSPALKAPIYTMGSADPGSFSRNKRGIAGPIINVDRHTLLDLVYKLGGQAIAASMTSSLSS